jgi:hypothetical protein
MLIGPATGIDRIKPATKPMIMIVIALSTKSSFIIESRLL